MPISVYELSDFLAAAGLTDLPPTIDLSEAVESGTHAWEDATGYVPFEAQTQTRDYAPDQVSSAPHAFPWLDLGAGVLSVSSVSITDPIRQAVTVLDAGRDYRLQPLDAPSRSRPYTWIEFISSYPTLSPLVGHGRITITGQFGYCAAATGEARHAMLCAAALYVLPLIQTYGGAYSQRTEGDASWTYSGGGYLERLSAAWRLTFERASGIGSRYYRVRVPW